VRELFCVKCETLLVRVRDGSIRKDIVVMCSKCANPNLVDRKVGTDVPDFFKDILKY